jgi:hypothetical protein
MEMFILAEMNFFRAVLYWPIFPIAADFFLDR